MKTRIPVTIANSINAILKKHEKIVIIPHVNPDGDAIGSALGLYHFLKNSGYKSNVVSPGSYPGFLHWMKGSKEVVEYPAKEAVLLINSADVIFCVDFNEPERAGKLSEHILKSSAKKILIDHHPNPSDFADITISDTSACATAELLFELIMEMGLIKHLDVYAAECLVAGIMTDTGSFSYSSSDPQTFRIMSHLLELGVDKEKLYTKIYNNFSAGRMRLMGYVLNEKMVVLPEYHTAYISLSSEEMERYNFHIGDSEGFVNLPLAIKGIEFSAYFMERDNEIKISFRSKGNFHVNKFSTKHFNGGGHKLASGGSDNLTLDKTIEKFEGLLEEYKDELK